MGLCYKYAVARFATGGIRDERLNVAIVVFEHDRLEVKIPRSLDKLKAISGAINLDLVRNALDGLTDLDSLCRNDNVYDLEARMRFIEELAPISFSPLGEFHAKDQTAFGYNLESLLRKLVEPEPAVARVTRRKATRLLLDVKSAFKNERVMAKKGEGLETHRIVANHKVAEGLSADLILKNGSMHIIQTADASLEEVSVRRTVSNIAVAALVFEQARMNYGEHNTKSRLVYKSSSSMEALISPALDAAEHQGATLVNWESRDDRNRFIIEVASLAEPIERHRSSQINVHASVQPRMKLN